MGTDYVAFFRPHFYFYPRASFYPEAILVYNGMHYYHEKLLTHSVCLVAVLLPCRD